MASQSLSSLFGAPSAGGGSSGGLFGAGEAQKFARVFKAPEFDLPTKKVPVATAGGELAGDVDPLEKPKKQRKERKPKGEASTDADATAATSTEGGEKQDLNTIFVGNIPTTETVKSLTKFLKVYGEIESIRLRSVPVAGAKVDEPGNQDLVRKVCVNSKKFGEQKGSFNAYVKFKEASSATAALAANNKLMGTRHLRVDRSNPTLFDPKRSVFLGGLPHYADEEELRDFFAQALPNGQDDIEGLRIIRDASTLVGKGIGYMLFKDRDSVLKALTLHKAVYKKRWPLRVSACGKRTKRTEEKKKGAAQESGDADDNEHADGDDGDGQAKKRKRDRDGGDEKRGGKKAKSGMSPAAEAALRRLKNKTVKTRNKILIERGQKKAQKGRHGKRLGGVVKRAMKAQKAQK